MRKGTLDRILEKAVSRKLFTFLTATGLMLWSDLDSETWGMIAVVSQDFLGDVYRFVLVFRAAGTGI